MLRTRIDRWFFILGVLCALGGMILGIVMGIREDFALAPVHAHINLVGFVTLALFGLAYRVGWARKDSWAVAHFVLSAAAALLLPVGIYIAIAYRQPALAIISSLLGLAAMGLCLVNCLRGLRDGESADFSAGPAGRIEARTKRGQRRSAA